MAFISNYLDEAIQIIQQIDTDAIDRMIRLISDLRKRDGRLFILGVGGGAGHAAHAVVPLAPE